MKTVLLCLALLFLSGCASVARPPQMQSIKLKTIHARPPFHR